MPSLSGVSGFSTRGVNSPRPSDTYMIFDSMPTYCQCDQSQGNFDKKCNCDTKDKIENVVREKFGHFEMVSLYFNVSCP